MLSFGFVVERQQSYSVQGSATAAAPWRAPTVGPTVVGGLSVKSVAAARGAELGLWVGEAPARVRDRNGTLGPEEATMGISVTLEEPTRRIRLDAITARMYQAWEWDYPQDPVLGTRELLEERRKSTLPPLVPPTYQPAERRRERGEEQLTLDEGCGLWAATSG